MLPNYDADGIAEVLGLAFLRGRNDDISASSHSETAKEKSRPAPHASDLGIVIKVDDAALLVVDVSTNDIQGSLDISDGGSDKGRVIENRLSRPSSVLIEKAVEAGLPRTALRHVAEWLAGDEKTKIAVFEWGVVPKTTLDRRDTRLSSQESERTERIARLFVHARRALGTAAEAREFMTTPHPELERRTPIDAAKTDLGTRRTERLLSAIEYGLAI